MPFTLPLALTLVGAAPIVTTVSSAPKTETLAVDGGTLAYTRYAQSASASRGGNAETVPAQRRPLVIAVPGIGDVQSEYRFLVGDLVARGCDVVTMDLRGHGASSATFSDVSVAAVAGDVIALVRHLDRGPAVLVGTSFGAAAVADAAARAPDLVAGVAVIGPFVRNQPASFVMSVVMGALFAGPWRTAAWVQYVDSLYPTQKPADHEAQLALLKQNLQEPGRFDALRKMMTASRAETEPRLAQVKAPALVVMGTKDPDFKDPAAEAAQVAQLLRGTVLMVDGAGHYPHAEMPERVSPALADFVLRCFTAVAQ